MKIFISWSDKPSDDIAKLLESFLKICIPNLDIFCSKSKLRKGKQWFTEIQAGLENSDFGILCLTESNTNNPWINFEAGALSKFADHAHICPILFGFNQDNLDSRSPFNNYMCTKFNEDDMRKLIETIRETQSVHQKETIEIYFQQFFPAFKKKVDVIISKSKLPQKEKTQKELLHELLYIARNINRSINPTKLDSENLLDLYNSIFKNLMQVPAGSIISFSELIFSLDYLLLFVEEEDSKKVLLDKIQAIKDLIK